MVTTVALHSIADEFFCKTALSVVRRFDDKDCQEQNVANRQSSSEKAPPSQKNNEHWLSATTEMESDTSAVQMNAVNELATIGAHFRVPCASLVEKAYRE